jgi:hypothetical protein
MPTKTGRLGQCEALCNMREITIPFGFPQNSAVVFPGGSWQAATSIVVSFERGESAYPFALVDCGEVMI